MPSSRSKSAVSNLLTRVKRSQLAADTASLAVGQGLRLVIQAVYFVLIARSLGPTGYGAFVAVTALTSIVAPFTGLGSGNLFIKNVRSGKRTAALCMGNGLLLTSLSGTALGMLIALVSFVLKLKIEGIALLAVFVSDLIFMRV